MTNCSQVHHFINVEAMVVVSHTAMLSIYSRLSSIETLLMQTMKTGVLHCHPSYCACFHMVRGTFHIQVHHQRDSWLVCPKSGLANRPPPQWQRLCWGDCRSFITRTLGPNRDLGFNSEMNIWRPKLWDFTWQNRFSIQPQSEDSVLGRLPLEPHFSSRSRQAGRIVYVDPARRASPLSI